MIKTIRKPLISVIIPCYNAENYILQAVGSVKSQKGTNQLFKLELIVVDDCSTDNTCELLKQHNVKCYSTKANSGGPNRGRNIGLELAKGDYICFMDHDDVWMKNRLVRQLESMNQAPISTCGHILENDAKNIRKTKSCNDKSVKLYRTNETFKKILGKSKAGQSTYFGSLMISKSLKNITFEEKYGMVDYDWLLSVFHNNSSVEICEPLFIRRVNDSNLSLNLTYRENDFNYSLEILDKYRPEYPALFSIGYKRLHEIKAKFHYIRGEMKLARNYMKKGRLNLKNILYYFTTFYGHRWVVKNFEVF